MSWAEELYNVYEYNCGNSDSEPVLLPVSHSTANAQIELTIDEKGNFRAARTVDKSEAETIIPVTEDSGARSSGICPMPFADKLVYIAGDYSRYSDGKRSDNSKFFAAYMEQLARWRDSEYSHKAAEALYAYLEKSEIMSDLIKSGVLTVDEESGKLADKVKIAGIDQGDAFVRVIVNYSDINAEGKTWRDKTLYESFTAFNSGMMGNRQLCYATGQVLPSTYKHPSKIRNSGDKAKLISSNDESGFTYRGRFWGKEEAISVSYDFSQKMHNALKWLIARQGMSFDTLTVVTWASQMQKIPDFGNSLYDDFDSDFWDNEDNIPQTDEQFNVLLKKCIFGYKDSIQTDTKVMLLGVDAATTGRLSIAMYTELMGSDYLDNIESWHKKSSWLRYNYKIGKHAVNSFSIYEIAENAFGTEQNGKIAKPKMFNDIVLRLIPCVTEGRRIPKDIISNLCAKASNPLAYEKDYNHRAVLETACGMLRLESEGEISMAYDKNDTDRSYLYGCLLAIADKTESDTYEKEERGKRVTNAKRYWNVFSSRPFQTWQVIEERLQPYLDKLGNYSTVYEKRVQEIMDKMDRAAFEDNSKLSPSYLLGYHHYMSYMYKSNAENKEEE